LDAEGGQLLEDFHQVITSGFLRREDDMNVRTVEMFPAVGTARVRAAVGLKSSLLLLNKGNKKIYINF
jgi:hypothetical protein